jgi:hypothetical protein
MKPNTITTHIPPFEGGPGGMSFFVLGQRGCLSMCWARGDVFLCAGSGGMSFYVLGQGDVFLCAGPGRFQGMFRTMRDVIIPLTYLSSSPVHI